MENVSKALMMAGGLLISLMVISLIVVLWGQLSGYFTEDSKTTVVEQDTKFNAQFENYNKKSIGGYDLISVINKIIDYNRTAADIKNYDRIKIKIKLNGRNFQYNGDTGTNIFKNKDPLSNIDDKDKDKYIEEISNLSTNLVKDLSEAEVEADDTKLQLLSANIANIVDDKVDEETRTKKLKSILGDKIADNNGKISENKISKIKSATMQYYQYIQFKRAMFTCTDVKYNQQNGRVNEMDFEIEK